MSDFQDLWFVARSDLTIFTDLNVIFIKLFWTLVFWTYVCKCEIYLFHSFHRSRRINYRYTSNWFYFLEKFQFLFFFFFFNDPKINHVYNTTIAFSNYDHSLLITHYLVSLLHHTISTNHSCLHICICTYVYTRFMEMKFV